MCRTLSAIDPMQLIGSLSEALVTRVSVLSCGCDNVLGHICFADYTRGWGGGGVAIA